MQAHSQLLLVLDEYCDDKRADKQMPWKMIGEKLYEEPAQRGYGFNYLELYVWVMDFLTQEEEGHRARENLRGSTQSVSAVTQTCHHCGSPDHVQRDCPKENAKACRMIVWNWLFSMLVVCSCFRVRMFLSTWQMLGQGSLLVFLSSFDIILFLCPSVIILCLVRS